MLDMVIVGGIGWTCALLALVAWAAVRADTTLGRVIAMDTLALFMIALLVLVGYARRSAEYLDAALVLGLLAFLGTLAAAEFDQRRGEE